MEKPIIKNIMPLGFMWPVANPFLFCAHHLDNYPPGSDAMGPAASLAGRKIGQDFTLKDGWRMYHGQTIPGFPVHPHRGFETITIVRQGMVDHSDSHGQAGRYGGGDVQWMTAGSGLQHCEMFPLLNRDKGNPAELFQLWLNLPAAKKFAEPAFKMLWAEKIPVWKSADETGRVAEVTVIAGRFGEVTAQAPAPDSWAADPASEVAVWTIRMDPGARLVLPAATGKVSRMLYFHLGSSLAIQGVHLDAQHATELDPGTGVELVNGSAEAHLLLLQGKPIDEPVVQYGPFVMNSEGEIRQAFADYRATEFGGWPWPRPDVVHPHGKGRFALYRDGTEEIP